MFESFNDDNLEESTKVFFPSFEVEFQKILKIVGVSFYLSLLFNFTVKLFDNWQILLKQTQTHLSLGIMH